MSLRKSMNEQDPTSEPVPAHVQKHPMFGQGGQSIGIMSGENPMYAANVQGHEQLKAHLKNLNLPFEETEGHYGAPEKSVIVHNPTREQMFELGKNFGQESVIFGHGGRHEMMYTNGAKQGKFHPSLPKIDFFSQPPPDYYTRLPNGGFVRMYFNDDQLLDSPLRHIQPAVTASPVEKSLSVSEALFEVYKLNKSLLAAPVVQVAHKPHPNAYAWHDPHTDHHYNVSGQGILICPSGIHAAPAGLVKAASSVHPHMDGLPNTDQHATNDQASNVGTSHYAKFAGPYGAVTPGKTSDLLHYPYHGKLRDIERVVKDHGYQTYYAGGKYGKPDLANRNYNTHHLMIYDPTPASGGDFGHEEYTKGWRQIHELAHALTYPELNQTYGEGRRIGKLGTHRSTREALRAVHWEWLAAHKQRELSKMVGVHIPDETFHKELGTVIHDAVHRSVTGRFTEPSGEGFAPYAHKVPLETALGTIREEGNNLGLHGMNDTLKLRKSVGENIVAQDRDMSPKEMIDFLAKSTRELIEKHAVEIENLHKRELAKSDPTHVCDWGLCTKGIKGEAKYCPEHAAESKYNADWRASAAAGKDKVPVKPSAIVKKFDGAGPGDVGPGSAAAGDTSMAMSEEHAEPPPYPNKNKSEHCSRCKESVQVLSSGKLAEHECKKSESEQYDKSDMTSAGPLCKSCKSHHPVGKCSSMKSELGKHEYQASEGRMCKSCGKDMGEDAHFEKPFKPYRDAKKHEDFIDLAHESEPGKRLKQVPTEGPGTLPSDKPSREISAPGSGGEIKKGKPLGKSEFAEHSEHAHKLLSSHHSRVLDDEGDRKAVARTLAPHLGAAGAKAFTESHSSRGLDDEKDYNVVHHDLSQKLRNGIKKADVPMAKPPGGKMPTPASVPQSKPAAGMKPMGKTEVSIPGRALFKAIPGQMGLQDQQAMVQAHTPKFSASAPAKATFGAAPVAKQGIQAQQADNQAMHGKQFAPAHSATKPAAALTAGLKPPAPGVKEAKPAVAAAGAPMAKPGIFGRLASNLAAPMGAAPKLPGTTPAPTQKSEPKANKK